MKWFPVLLVVFGSVTLFFATYSLYLSTWIYEMTGLMFLGGMAFLALSSLILWLFHLLTVDLGIKA